MGIFLNNNSFAMFYAGEHEEPDFEINYFDDNLDKEHCLIGFNNHLPVERYIGFIIGKSSPFTQKFIEK
jgi:hypothetical protein